MSLGLLIAADEGAAEKEAALSCRSVAMWNSGTSTNTPEGPAWRGGARKSGGSVSGGVLFDTLWWWGVRPWLSP